MDFLPKTRVQDVIQPYIEKRALQAKNQQFREANGAAIILASHFCELQDKDDLSTPKTDINLMERLLVNTLAFRTAVKTLEPTLERIKAQTMFSDISALNLERYHSFFFYYSGHADECGILLPSGHPFSYLEIIKSVCSCESLEGKPKIFLFDCSRIVASRDSQKQITDNDLPPDCLVVFSTSHKCTAFGDKEKGSFFTQEFVKDVTYYVDAQNPVEVLSVIRDVRKAVGEYVIRRTARRSTQGPEILNTLKSAVTLPHLGMCLYVATT